MLETVCKVSISFTMPNLREVKFTIDFNGFFVLGVIINSMENTKDTNFNVKYLKTYFFEITGSKIEKCKELT